MVSLAVLTVLYIAGLAMLLLVAKRYRGRYALAKGICSLLFVAAGVLAWTLGPGGSWQRFALLLAALVLCAFGDVLLGVANKASQHPDKRYFIAGALSFAAAHVLFVLLFAALAPFRWYDWAPSLLLVGILLVLDKKDKVRLKKMRPLAYVYTALIGLMFWKAVGGLLFTAAPGPGAVVICVGAALFLLSDVILLFLYFGVRRFKWLRSANLLTYYVGIYLLSLSAFWL